MFDVDEVTILTVAAVIITITVALTAVIGMRILKDHADSEPESLYSLVRSEYSTIPVQGVHTNWYEFTNNSDKPVVPESVISVEGAQLSCDVLGIESEGVQAYDVEVPAGGTVSIRADYSRRPGQPVTSLHGFRL